MVTGVLMVAGSAPLPTLPALDWDPMELAGEGIGERGDGDILPLQKRVHARAAFFYHR